MNQKFKFISLSILAILFCLTVPYLFKSHLTQNIIGTQISILGLIFSVTIISASIMITRHTYFKLEKINYVPLILRTVLIIGTSELVFQIGRQFFMESDSFNSRLITIGNATLSIVIFSLIVSFLTAFQLKTKKTGVLLILTIGILFLINLLIKYLNLL